MKLTIENWGQVEDQEAPVKLITLENKNNLTVKVTNFGCIVTSIETPDRYGNKEDVVLGYENLTKYLNGHPFFGAIAGRFANRIKDGRYELNGSVFQLEKNEAVTQQHLHGGLKGFDKFVWSYAIEELPNITFIHLSRVSPAGESGYGGTLTVKHSIGLDNDNQIHFNFSATTDAPTVVNFVNHSYYNLGGHDSGTVDQHELKLYADFYTPVDEHMLPTGEILSVKKGSLDFTTARKINDIECDCNFVINKNESEGDYYLAADLYDPDSGRAMSVLTTQPGIQVYNGFKLSTKAWFGRNGYKYESRNGLCLETQHFPDSPNQKHFPSTRLDPGEVFEEKTIHRFSIR